MKLLVLHFVFASSLLALIESKSIIRQDMNGEPRIFFRQMIEASGLFPLEINVPDTLSTMMSTLSTAYDTMSMFFGNGGTSGQGEEGQSQSESVKIDRKKKVKRKKKKIIENDYDYDFLQYLML